VCVCVDVCDVCGSRPEFLNEDIPAWPKICSIHPVIRHTKPDTQIPPASFPFPVPNVEGVGKNLKISYSMIDSSAVWKAIAVRCSLLDRARRAAHWANIGFSIPDYSPVLHRLKCPAQWWTLTDGPVLVPPSGEYVYIGVTQCEDALSTQPLTLLYTTNSGRIQPMFWVVSTKMWMGRFLNVYPNIILTNLYSAVLCLLRELTHEWICVWSKTFGLFCACSTFKSNQYFAKSIWSSPAVLYYKQYIFHEILINCSYQLK
jgi:hypothetical protein